ncbi:hypothetical protein VOLCADRAFT_106942 [Volvox carteri f. nagariensis]|uniref:Uncharacterized protein n=1 Tax=Volvox carteri f. nagariensis TaxID=3068 RepID=D8UAR9_VOLCA|nr:uncharacterized protein VOLCADRAFT_106942 [Volvox carteri f. nagariensis]EFJ43206.1 hypothetical protein VOLCADRAFT_106942 [Volvox carteri f. nagariensis]|eukprot:XP_002955781.1 hypothetical protein VOLCADRAFT_106942 [Volvox carteri f. nagariensis]
MQDTLVLGRDRPGLCITMAWPNPGPRNMTIRCQPSRACRPNPAGGLITLASTVKEGRKSTSGVKGDGSSSSSSSSNRTGSSRSPASTTSSRTTSGRTDGSGSTRSSPSPPQQPAPRQTKQQQKQQRSSPSQPPGSPRSGTNSNSNASRLDVYMRKHPFFSRFYDTTLLLGDCVMILATELHPPVVRLPCLNPHPYPYHHLHRHYHDHYHAPLSYTARKASSERIEWSSFPALVGVLLVCWVATGVWNGDYSPAGSRAHEDVPWQLSMLGPTFGSVLGAALTWAFASTASIAAYAVLVARNALDAAPVVEGLNSDDLSPQLEAGTEGSLRGLHSLGGFASSRRSRWICAGWRSAILMRLAAPAAPAVVVRILPFSFISSTCLAVVVVVVLTL